MSSAHGAVIRDSISGCLFRKRPGAAARHIGSCKKGVLDDVCR